MIATEFSWRLPPETQGFPCAGVWIERAPRIAGAALIELSGDIGTETDWTDVPSHQVQMLTACKAPMRRQRAVLIVGLSSPGPELWHELASSAFHSTEELRASHYLFSYR